MSQRHLWKLEPSTEGLTDKQRLVVTLLQETPEGLRSSDLGRALHLHRGAPCACSPSTFCKWAMSTGESVGKQLRSKEPPVAIKRKTGLWQLTRPPVTGHDPATAGWPEGF